MLISQRPIAARHVTFMPPSEWPGDAFDRLGQIYTEEQICEAMMKGVKLKPKLPTADAKRQSAGKAGGTPSRDQAEKRRKVIMAILRELGPLSVSQIHSYLPAATYDQCSQSLQVLRKTGQTKVVLQGGRKWDVA